MSTPIMMTPSELVAVKRWLEHQREFNSTDLEKTFLNDQLDMVEKLVEVEEPEAPLLRKAELVALRTGLLAAFDVEQRFAENKGELHSWVWSLVHILEEAILPRLSETLGPDDPTYDDVLEEFKQEPYKFALVLRLIAAATKSETIIATRRGDFD